MWRLWWACDYYQIGAKCISTGYNPIGNDINYTLLNEYEAKAKNIVNDYTIEYNARVKMVDKLLIELLNTVN